MSFSKAPIKRFNEIESDTPGPNEYVPKDINAKGAGIAIALKENRFPCRNEATPGPGQYNVHENKNVPKNVHVIGNPKDTVRPSRSLHADQKTLLDKNSSIKVESSTKAKKASFAMPHTLHLQNTTKDRKIEQPRLYTNFDLELKSLEDKNNAMTAELNTKTEELAAKDEEIKRWLKLEKEFWKQEANLESRLGLMEKTNTKITLELSAKVNKLAEKHQEIEQLKRQLQQYLDLDSKFKSLEDKYKNEHTAFLKLEGKPKAVKNENEDHLFLIGPLKDQLGSFEADRITLLARNKEAQGEVKKIAAQYGLNLVVSGYCSPINVSDIREGWKERESKSTGQKYYVNKFIDPSQWAKPTEPSLAGKITDMEKDNSELDHMLEHGESRNDTADETVAVFQPYQSMTNGQSMK